MYFEAILYNLGSRDEEESDEELNTDWVAELGTVARACRPSRKRINLFAATSIPATHPMLDGTAS